MEVRKKKPWLLYVFTVLCIAVLGFSLTACSGSSDTSGSTAEQKQSEQGTEDQDGTRIFVDSAGREVEVPAQLDFIAPSGHTAQQVLLTMAPEKIVGLSQELTDDQLKYFDAGFDGLPVLGAAFGSKGDMNKEAVAASGAQIVIDTGEFKDGLKEDLDNLQAQLGIPVVFIQASLDGYATMYKMLGDLLGMEERGKELGDYCTKAYTDTEEFMSNIPDSERVNVAYLLGDSGLNAIAKNSYQGAILDMCANNVVEVEKATGSGLGNEISLEQIAVWAPELIVFGADSIYDTVGSEAAWSGIPAIESGNYYVVPSEPWVWLNNPPTVNQILGMQWFPRVCYPDYFDDDMQEVVTGYFKTFYDYDLTKAEFETITAGALPK